MIMRCIRSVSGYNGDATEIIAWKQSTWPEAVYLDRGRTWQPSVIFGLFYIWCLLESNVGGKQISWIHVALAFALFHRPIHEPVRVDRVVRVRHLLVLLALRVWTYRAVVVRHRQCVIDG